MGYGKTRSFSSGSPWPPFIYFYDSVLRWGIACSKQFDLGQKEIETWTFCISAAVYLIITANNDTDCIETLGPHVSFELASPPRALHLASYCLQRKNRIGFGRYLWFSRGIQGMQSGDGAHELSLAIVDSVRPTS